MKKLRLICITSMILLLSSCFYTKNVKKPEVEIVPIEWVVSDLFDYSQDPLYYANLYNPDSLLILDEQQQDFLERFKRRFFRVWRDSLNEESPRTIEVMDYHTVEIKKLYRSPGYGENKLLRDTEYARDIEYDASLENGFNTMKKGIILNYSYIRVVPSFKPYYLDFSLPGEGYPFDYWQNSTIPIGTPIFIYHENDNWALIDSHICSGWVPRNLIAYLDDDHIEQLMSAPLISIIKDKTPIYNINDTYLGHADIGTVFFQSDIVEVELASISEKEEFIIAHFFTKDEYNNAQPTKLKIKREVTTHIPAPLTMRNISILCNEMMNQVYGWGGLYYNRDCSQTMLDLFTPFGILLPRNSRAQAYNFGTFISMKDITEPIERKEFIIANSTPFHTLVRTPGHIMLYIGHIDNEPMVFHSIWGVRTINPDNSEGRFIIGKTVITTLEPGKNIPSVKPDRTLINRVEGITLFSIRN